MTRFRKIAVFFVILLVTYLFARPAYAIQFGLTAPSGTLTRGQEVDFIVTIDTQGDTVKNKSIGLTYKTEFLQYIRTSNGNTMDSVTDETKGTNELIITGTSATGFKGSGQFAKVTFKLIADSPGSAEGLCTFAPSQPSVTTAPTSSTSPAPTSPPASPAATAPPVGGQPAPTALPASGSAESTNLWGLWGAGLITAGFLYHVVNKRKHLR